jgi:hypothetical protein
MEYHQKLEIAEKIYERFGQAARKRMDMRPLDQILEEVIEHWIVHGFGNEDGENLTIGFQWKTVFLASGTKVRLYYRGRYYQGEVIGDDFVYGGDHSSPNKMVVQITGGRRNAWRDLSVLLPGQSAWKPARELRA